MLLSLDVESGDNVRWLSFAVAIWANPLCSYGNLDGKLALEFWRGISWDENFWPSDRELAFDKPPLDLMLALDEDFTGSWEPIGVVTSWCGNFFALELDLVGISWVANLKRRAAVQEESLALLCGVVHERVETAVFDLIQNQDFGRRKIWVLKRKCRFWGFRGWRFPIFRSRNEIREELEKPILIFIS